MLNILYEDEKLIAIHKPHGLLVHRSPIARDAKTFVIQELRDQINQYVYPCHRLDRKTCGVLLLAKDKETQSAVNKLFAERHVEKRYHAIVRGWTDDALEIDYALTNDRGQTQDALTKLKTLKKYEISVPLGKYATQRYSLVELTPHTGRMHQLRKHMSHIFHPIIGDRPHGCNKQNRLWKQKWDMTSMMLCAYNLRIPQPYDIEISSSYSEVMQEVINRLEEMNIS